MGKSAQATIIIGTFGDYGWYAQAQETALQTEAIQECPVIHQHAGSLAAARNSGARQATTEWLCFLDADDRLEEDYIQTLVNGSGDLRAPRLFFTEPGREPYEPFDLKQRHMAHGNPCVIGTLIRKSLFEAVGGFQRWRAWEDWAMFYRAWMLGAEIVHHDTIYLASNRPESRNNTVKNPKRLYKDIQKDTKEWFKSQKLQRL